MKKAGRYMSSESPNFQAPFKSNARLSGTDQQPFRLCRRYSKLEQTVAPENFQS